MLDSLHMDITTTYRLEYNVMLVWTVFLYTTTSLLFCEKHRYLICFLNLWSGI